jgi:excisionase family DNA binding protein
LLIFAFISYNRGMFEDMITVNQAAKIIGVTPGRIRQLIAENHLPATKVGEGRGGVWLIKRDDLERIKVRPGPGRPKSRDTY